MRQATPTASQSMSPDNGGNDTRMNDTTVSS